MPTTNADQSIQTMQITKDEMIEAPIEIVFQAMLDELGPESQMPGGKPLPLKLEPWPGGRQRSQVLGRHNGRCFICLDDADLRP